MGLINTCVFVFVFLHCVLCRSALKREGSSLIHKDNYRYPSQRLPRNSDSQSESESDAGSDTEFYALDFPKRFFPGFHPRHNSSSKNAVLNEDVRMGITFPSEDSRSSKGVIPYRFSRPSVNSEGKLSFLNSGSPQAMAGTGLDPFGDLKPETISENQQRILLLENQLIEERVLAFTNWVQQNKPVEGTGAVIVASAEEDQGLGVGNFALSAGGILACPDGQALRNGNCEEIAEL